MPRFRHDDDGDDLESFESEDFDDFTDDELAQYEEWLGDDMFPELDDMDAIAEWDDGDFYGGTAE